AMLNETRNRGAPSPLGGMSSAASQQASATTMTSDAIGQPAFGPDSKPAVIVPVRMAMNVAPSTNALAAGNFSRGRWSGRMPYLSGPNSEASTPKPNKAMNNTGT